MNRSMFEIQAEFFKALGAVARIQILYALREHPMMVGEIGRATDLPQSNVSRNLIALRAVRVVNSKRHGPEVVYQIADRKVVDVCDLARSILVESAHQRSQSIE